MSMKRNSRLALVTPIVIPVIAVLLVVGISSIALAQAGGPNADEAADSGVAGSGRIIATTNIVSGKWGVFGYTSRAGLTCLTAGPMQNGKVGMYGPNGFRAMRAEEAPGNCGDIAQNLVELGGVALASASPVAAGSNESRGVIYGVVAPDTVAVYLRDGSAEPEQLTVTATQEIGGTAGAFVTGLPENRRPGSMHGLVIEIEKADGSRTELPF